MDVVGTPWKRTQELAGVFRDSLDDQQQRSVPSEHLTNSSFTVRPPTRPALRALGTVPPRDSLIRSRPRCCAQFLASERVVLSCLPLILLTAKELPPSAMESARAATTLA
jgi:hypothetical protein